MADEPPKERRRTTRLPADGAHPVAVSLTLPVRLINVSTTGFLIRSPHPLTAGSRVTLKVLLGTEAMVVPVEIRGTARKRVRNGPAGPYEFGASVVFSDEAERLRFERALQAALKTGNSGNKES